MFHRQAADAKNGYILGPHPFPRDQEDKTADWKHRDWQKAFTDSMQAVGLPYSGEYMWVKTSMCRGVNHEVMPANMALSCVQCHESLKGERTCNRCHPDSRDVNFKQVTHAMPIRQQDPCRGKPGLPKRSNGTLTTF